ncbi:TRM11 family SAM-dependent methyltransferase [Marinitoga aeolica]|uniref:Methyltransferase n=1 Tax=Marinitoga aeolica TaxID=2809031 RepID=A0ABY8PSZ7_9BACT|nr:DNA methyltransferase [Marinitoga aeolica]WGS65761.1 methyltransferase domain-containing protein [Marinitoga aeolica]
MNNFKDDLEFTTVWSFPERGKWETHNSKYRGNFAPQVAKNIILRYSNEDDIVLDPMVGGGTSLIEAKLLNRKSIGVDINPKAIEITRKNIVFNKGKYEPKIFLGDARNLNFLENNSIDLILTHPPYLNIIKYSEGKIPGDFSNISGVKKFCNELEYAIKELYRVLKPGKYCAILIGDTRKNRHYIPLSYYVMQKFLKNGFILKEDIIKVQHNCQTTPYWKAQVNKYNFYLIMHEHLFIFRKPFDNEDTSKFIYSKYNCL